MTVSEVAVRCKEIRRIMRRHAYEAAGINQAFISGRPPSSLSYRIFFTLTFRIVGAQTLIR